MVAYKFNILFKWHRDEAYEAMNDSILDERANQFVQDQKDTATTCQDLREIMQRINDANDILSIQALSEFLKREWSGHPRYVSYIMELIEYGPYMCHPDKDPSKSQEFLNSIKIVEDGMFGFTAEFTISEDFLLEDWTHDDYVKEINSFRDALADTLWEGMPGSVAVHESCAVVEFRCW